MRETSLGDPGKALAVAAFGGVGKLAEAISISSQAVSQWGRVPEKRALQIVGKKPNALRLHDLRPDRWGPEAELPAELRAA